MEIPDSIPVKVEGLSPSTYVLVAILTVIVGGLIKVWPALRKIAAEGDQSLRQDLMRRVHDLEAELKAEREDRAKSEALLHGQIHELRNSMVELTLAAGRMTK
ncbi:hypothetical protein D3Y57_19290 [Sphingomonas paeninsulae]|uniref:Uncharacterized protein n=2 Tax=Sphingomonas paeninsulae TaxID=2319844 RepID=A0A494TQD9_SPHPE|nr:hypothetical protein D3Y57_19290 [Sphingomonas paeninsulae]